MNVDTLLNLIILNKNVMRLLIPNLIKIGLAKYKSESIYDSVMYLFDALPLAATVDAGNNTVFFCTHGV